MHSDTHVFDNIDKIRHIPASIVQGRYDVVCPTETAWQLHKVGIGELSNCVISARPLHMTYKHFNFTTNVQGGLKPTTLGDFSEHTKLRESLGNSVQHQGKDCSKHLSSVIQIFE